MIQIAVALEVTAPVAIHLQAALKILAHQMVKKRLRKPGSEFFLRFIPVRVDQSHKFV